MSVFINNMKTIILSGNVIDYNNFIPLETKWLEAKVKYGKKYYDVLTAEVGNCQLIKPNQEIKECRHCKETNRINKGGYHEFEYENLFGFTNHCENFSPNKIVNITSAM